MGAAKKLARVEVLDHTTIQKLIENQSCDNPRCFGKCSPVYANLVSSLISGKIIYLQNSWLKTKVFVIYSLMFDLCASGRYLDVWSCVKITRVERGPSGKSAESERL